MTETSGRLLELLSLLQARRDWPGAELADRLGRVRADDPPRRRAAARARLPRGLADRPGRRLPASRRDRDAAAAARRRGGDRDRRRPAHRRARLRDRNRGDCGARAGQARAGPARHLRRRVRALGSATISPPVGGPTVDPQHLTVIAAACRDSERLRFAYRSRDGTDSRREVEPHALVNLGWRWYLVAWDRGREDWRTFRVDRLTRPAATGVRFTPRRLPAKDAAAFVRASIIGAPNRFEARVTLRAPGGGDRGPRPRLIGARSSRSTRTRASTAPATTTSGGWRCAWRCSASTSRCTSRPSWSSICGRWPTGSSAPSAPDHAPDRARDLTAAFPATPPALGCCRHDRLRR